MIERLEAALADRYRIERELGAGGMATVFLAHDLRHDRKVALKVLRPELAAVVGAERFVAEIRTTANLQHPHILPLFDSGETSGFLWYAMPYMEGGETLRDRLEREKQLPVGDAVEIAGKVASALQAAHERGVVHRDVKPANILLDRRGEPLVADFGIALAVQQAGGERLTETGLSLGTPYYMSPEQASGDRDPDARSDVYSLGCVLYEMLVGEPPFPGSTAQAVLARILTAEPPPPSEQRRSVPAHVEAVVLKALEKLPADRFATAAGFAAALEDPDAALRPPPRATGRSPRAASGLLTGAVGAVALLVGVAAGAWLRPPPTERVARYALALPSGQKLSEGLQILDVLPDGSAFVYAGFDGEGNRGIFLRPLASLDPTFLPGTERGLAPAASPDGSRVAFVGSEGRGRRELRVVGIEGTAPLTLADSAVDEGGVSWGEDGWIYYDGALEGDGIARIREDGGAPEIFTVPDTAAGERFHIQPRVLPGGRGVLFVVARGNVATGEEDQVAVAPEPGRHRVLIERATTPVYAPSGHLLFVREGRLLAVRFDLDDLTVSGTPVPVADGLLGGVLGMSHVALSPEGTLVYVAAPGTAASTDLVWVDRAGGRETIDLELPGPLDDVALSPDGTRAAMVVVERTGAHLWVAELEAGVPRKLTFDGGPNDMPGWSPDGGRIVFRTQRNEGWSLHQVPADGGERSQRISSTTAHILGAPAYPAYSPDGRWLLTVEGGPDADILIRHAGPDSAPRPLVTAPGSQILPEVSPDGRWLAYASDESGTSEVYVSPFPDVGRSRTLVSQGGGSAPKWSADGTELFWLTADRVLVAAAVRPGDAFRVGRAVPLFDHGAVSGRVGVRYGDPYGVHPDGDRFLVIAPDRVAEPHLVVVEGFLRELEERGGG